MKTLYLNFDGVLHPNQVTFGFDRRPRMRVPGHCLFEHNDLLERAIKACPQTEIILHSWWVPLCGYRASVEVLSPLVQAHVRGATWPGNRLLRVRRPIDSRRQWLCRDLLRRQPINPVLLDCDYRQVLSVLAENSCIVNSSAGLASVGACERLVALLAIDGVRQLESLAVSEMDCSSWGRAC